MNTACLREFFDQQACCRGERVRGARLVRSSRALLGSMAPDDVRGRRVLEVGCGFGSLTVECVLRGAAKATGVDLSPVAIATARRRAAELGLEDRTTFAAADAATARLEAHDLVVLDKVICCFFHPEALVGNTVAAATHTYAVSLPTSEGVWGVVNRAHIRVENTWHALRGRNVRAFNHPIEPIDKAIRRAGFDLVSSRHHGIWDLRVYRKV